MAPRAGLSSGASCAILATIAASGHGSLYINTSPTGAHALSVAKTVPDVPSTAMPRTLDSEHSDARRVRHNRTPSHHAAGDLVFVASAKGIEVKPTT